MVGMNEILIYNIIPLIFLIIIYFIWKKYGEDEKVNSITSKYPPNNLNILQVSYLYTDDINDEDFTPFMIQLAKEGYIKIIKEKIYELQELTEQLFEFSKTVDVDLEVKKEECCLNDILEESLANYYNQFKEKNIIPKISISNKKINKMVNRIAIIRIFENILSNVLKYSNGNFEVILNDDGIITFSNKANSLDAITVQKIFDRYFTVENAKESTGIGLAIAKQLIEQNRGKITAEYVNGYLIIKLYL